MWNYKIFKELFNDQIEPGAVWLFNFIMRNLKKIYISPYVCLCIYSTLIYFLVNQQHFGSSVSLCSSFTFISLLDCQNSKGSLELLNFSSSVWLFSNQIQFIFIGQSAAHNTKRQNKHREQKINKIKIYKYKTTMKTFFMLCHSSLSHPVSSDKVKLALSSFYAVFLW